MGGREVEGRAEWLELSGPAGRFAFVREQAQGSPSARVTP